MDEISNNCSETEKQREYAGFWLRVIAYLVDVLIITVADLLIDKLIPFNWFKIIIPLGYFVWFNSSRYQGTIGKIIVGIKITDLEGNRITFVHALARFCFPLVFLGFQLLCGLYWWTAASANNTAEAGIAIGLYFISLLGALFGLLMAAFTVRKQALHDIVCKTYVVKKGCSTAAIQDEGTV